MYFEIYRKGKLIKRGTSFLGDISWDNEMMYVPSTEMTLPITYREYFTGREEVRIFINDKCFWGAVVDVSLNKEEETITVNLEHIIREWSYREISVNNAIKGKTINFTYKEEEAESDPTVSDQLSNIYNDTNFAYPGWGLSMSPEAAATKIDYVYSKQNKLDALTKTVELTPDLFWRVGFYPRKVVEISAFGDMLPLTLSKKPTGKNNVRIITDPTIDYDFSEVYNLATVYSEKSDSGMSSMTLREVYEDPSLQLDGFPVVILRENVNNERDYKKYTYQYPKLAPNNDLEYAVLDEESIAMESGTVIETSFAFNDLSPFTEEEDGETKEITDDDRIEAAKVAYQAVVRKLKQSRRKYDIIAPCEPLPNWVNVGDKVRFIYDNSVYVMEECSNYMKKILTIDDWFYITRIEYAIDGGVETDTVTLSKTLKIDREVKE